MIHLTTLKLQTGKASLSFLTYYVLLDNPENWENKTLPDFLEALSAYTEDVQGYYNNIKLDINADKPDWSTFADILKVQNLRIEINTCYKTAIIRDIFIWHLLLSLIWEFIMIKVKSSLFVLTEIHSL